MAHSLNTFKSPPQAPFLNVVFPDSSSPPCPSSRFTFFNSTYAFLIIYLSNFLFNLVSICLSPLESKLHEDLRTWVFVYFAIYSEPRIKPRV